MPEPATVLARHEDIAFLAKPSGLLVHSSAWAGRPEPSLVDEARALLGPGFHPLHRLDRGTSGVVAFAREGTVSKWQEALARPDADKRYWALVRGHLRAPSAVDHPIKDEETGVVRAARSEVRPLLQSSAERCSLVEIRLFTGRRHQARRHLKHLSHPVIGDATHGKGQINRAFRDRWGLARLGLHARLLVLTHPMTGARVGAVAPLPADLRAPLLSLFGDTLLTVERENPHVAGYEVSR
jgi:tRNA pseudouridine65 synthase